MSLDKAGTEVLKPAEGMVTLNHFSLEIIAVKSVGLTQGKESRLWPHLFGISELKTSLKRRLVSLYCLDYLPFCTSYEHSTVPVQNLKFIFQLLYVRGNNTKVQPPVRSVQIWQTDMVSLFSKQCLIHTP